jgi:hypothetical protein
MMAEKRPLQSLETRIAAALNGTGVTSSLGLTDLLQELETEIVVADAAAKVAEEHALDPAVLDDWRYAPSHQKRFARRALAFFALPRKLSVS